MGDAWKDGSELALNFKFMNGFDLLCRNEVKKEAFRQCACQGHDKSTGGRERSHVSDDGTSNLILIF